MRSKKAPLFLAVALLVTIVLGACAPDVKPSGETSAPSSSAVSGGECAVCHTEEADSMANASLLAAAHAPFDCANCHTEDAIGAIHDGITEAPDEDQAKALRKKGRTMGTSEFCLTCHGSLEELAAKTTEVTVVQDTMGNITNPHAIPVNDRHAEGNVQECFNCHWLHKNSPVAISNCNSCHHAGVYECGTCHAVEL